MAFVDEVSLTVIAGGGGNGCVSFRREKYVPFGGPNGGNGGCGGDVFFHATSDKTTLVDFRYRARMQAKRGTHGKGKDMDGRGGEDLMIPVPVGTVVFDAETGDEIVDLSEGGQSYLIARGGRGGRGNLSFMSSTHRAPRIATKGEDGERKKLRLELRVMADVGLTGLPNAGKSSFLRAVSKARPRVADFPFTTLEPHLGVVVHKGASFVMADLPGLIEGASEGHGLGHRFLKHVRRNRLLLHLCEIRPTLNEMRRDIAVIEKELVAFDADFSDRERILVCTKSDLFDSAWLEKVSKAFARKGTSIYLLSTVTGRGISALLDGILGKLSSFAEDRDSFDIIHKATGDASHFGAVGQ